MAQELSLTEEDTASAFPLKRLLPFGVMMMLVGLLIGYQGATSSKPEPILLDPRELMVPWPKRWGSSFVAGSYYILAAPEAYESSCYYPQKPFRLTRIYKASYLTISGPLDHWQLQIIDKLLSSTQKPPKLVQSHHPGLGDYYPLCSRTARIHYED